MITLWKQELSRRSLPASSLNKRQFGELKSLPVCHPADYEWRFTETTARLLLERALSSLEPGGSIVHVGTPTTFALGVESYQEYRHILLERNTAISERVSCSVSRPQPLDPASLESVRVCLPSYLASD